MLSLVYSDGEFAGLQVQIASYVEQGLDKDPNASPTWLADQLDTLCDMKK